MLVFYSSQHLTPVRRSDGCGTMGNAAEPTEEREARPPPSVPPLIYSSKGGAGGGRFRVARDVGRTGSGVGGGAFCRHPDAPDEAVWRREPREGLAPSFFTQAAGLPAIPVAGSSGGSVAARHRGGAVPRSVETGMVWHAGGYVLVAGGDDDNGDEDGDDEEDEEVGGFQVDRIEGGEAAVAGQVAAARRGWVVEQDEGVDVEDAVD